MPTPRPIQHDEIAALGELLDDVFRRPQGITDQHQLTDYPLVFAAVNSGNCRVIVEQGRIVSHAALWPRELILGQQRWTVGVVVSVATDPDYRGRGYAAALMRDLQRTLHEQEYDLGLLWTTVPDFYRKLGWETNAPSGAMVTVPAACGDALSEPFQFRRYDAARDLEGIMVLHEREPVRFQRTRAEWATLLNLPKVEVWVAWRDSRLAAYLVHGKASNKRGLTEYGGELDGITALIAHVCEREHEPSGAADLPLLVYPARPDLADWCRLREFPSVPLQGSKGPAYEMLYQPQPERVPAELREQLFVWGLDHV